MTFNRIIVLVATLIGCSSAFAEIKKMTKSGGLTIFKGDFRYRHEDIDDASKDVRRSRQRMRLRIGLEKKVSRDFNVIVRVASGDQRSNSTNQSLDGGFSSKGAWLDLAYFKMQPMVLKEITLQAGKMKNPFFCPGDSS